MPHALHPSSTTPVAGCRETQCPRKVAYGSRRRKASVRSTGCGTLLFLAMMLASTAGASPFKSAFKSPFKRWGNRKGGKGKGGQQQSVSSKRSSTGKRDKVKEDVAWLLEDASDGGWKPVRDDGRVKVWKRSIPGSDFVAIKSSATLSVSPQALFEVLTPGDIEIVQQYNALVESGRDLEVMDRDNKVSWSATMAIWPCRPRDFVTHIRRAILEDGSVAIVNSATTHPKAPVSGRYVRGEISRGVFHIKPAKNKKQQSELTMVHHFNPGGNVPAWLMNWLAEGKPLTFVRQLEEVAAKWDEQASRSRTMPCKGRGFADKPCEFLLSPKDDADNADAGNLWWAWANRSGGEWLVLAAVLVTTVLALYGRAICRDSPLGPIGGLVGLVGLVGAEKEEEPSQAVNGQKLKEENGTRAVVDAPQTSAPGTPVESVSGASVDNVPEVSVEWISGKSVENGPEVSVGRVSNGEALNGGLTARGVADGVVIGDLSTVETNDINLSCQQDVTVENAFGGQVSTDKAGIDGEDTPTGEVMTSDVSSEEVRDGEVDGGSSDGLTEATEAKETGRKLLLDHVAAENLSNQAMPDGDIGNGEGIAVGGVGAEGRRREQEGNGGGGGEISTNGSVAAVGCVSEEAGYNASGSGYR